MFKKYLGMSAYDALTRFPSYVRGSILQTLYSHQKSKEFKYIAGRPNVVLVPGLFCSPSVFNKLGTMMEDRVNVFTPPPFPYYASLLNNIAGLEKTTDCLVEYLRYLKNEGIDKVSLVGHSYGGLICLNTVIRVALFDPYPSINKLICVASPLKGTPVAQLLQFIPACRDMTPGKDAITYLSKYHHIIDTIMVSELDTVVPFGFQHTASSANRYIIMGGYQHMDFYVGSEEQIQNTADILVTECSI